MKFYGMMGHNPETNRLDFGGNMDPECFEGIFTTVVLALHLTANLA